MKAGPRSARRCTHSRNASNGFAVRCANLQTVLNLLHDRSPLSSPEVCELLGLRASTVARIMGSLQASNLVHEVTHESPRALGRPPKVWSLNRRAGFVVGVAVNPMVLRAVLSDLGGERVAVRTFAYEPPLTASNVASAVCQAVDSVTSDTPRPQVYGVGVGVSGVVDPDHGIVRLSGGLLTKNGHHATEYPLAEEMARLVPWPIRIANDANVGALAAFRRMVRRGDLPPDGSLLYIMAVESLWGFGSGIVVGGRLYSGARGAAGEILHPHLLSRPPDWGNLPSRALDGDQDAVLQVLEGLRPMLEHFAALAMSLDTDRVVLGGALASLGHPLQRLMGDIVAATPGFGPYLADVPEHAFVLDDLWPDTLLLGAAELVLDNLFREPVVGQPGPLVRVALGEPQVTLGGP